MERYLFVGIIKVAPFEEDNDFQKIFFFQTHAHLLFKNTYLFPVSFLCIFNNRIKRIQENDGYYEGETKNNIQNG